MPRPPALLLAGCGKMGSALLDGWFKSFPDLAVTVIDPVSRPSDNRAHYLTSSDQLEDDIAVDFLILAVKPQVMNETCHDLKDRLIRGTPVLSIAAGKNLAYFSAIFGEDRPVIRSMPNTPAAIGHGITVACANARIDSPQKALADRLLCAVGQVEWIEDETLMDAVTAVSGSGPAYVFLLIEELARAGETAGLPAALAMKLARQTVIGSAHLAEASAGIPADMLRQNVTSPGGTTAAALEVLMGERALSKLIADAVTAAVQRSLALARS